MEPKIAFLFGAGASQPPGEIQPYPPPLGNRLYDELEKEFPATWGALDEKEKAVFRGAEGFEAGMTLLWEKFDERAWPALIDIGRYFLRFRPPRNQADCYSRLVIALKARDLIERTAVTSLNYECLFELAAMREGVGFDEDESDRSTLMLAKPHGSCNLIAKMNAGPNFGVVGSPDVQNLVLAPIEVIWDLDEIEEKYRKGYSVPPLMSMFAPSKHSPINIEDLIRMRKHWKAWAAAAEVIVVVGARPYFVDAHVWDPIIESNAAVWYVGGKDGDFERLAESLGSRLDYLGCKFGECLTDLLRRLGDLPDRADPAEESEAGS